MPPTEPRTDGTVRHVLAARLTVAAVLGIAAISITVIIASPSVQRLDAAKYVMVAVLPVLSSWVATVLAYYFAKENLAAATQSVTDLSNAARGDAKLPLIRVADKMIEATRIVSLIPELAKDDTPLTAILEFTKSRGVGRLPVFDDGGRLVRLLCDEILDRFIREGLGATQDNAAITYRELIDDAAYKPELERFAFVAKNATLADAKAALNSVAHCNDVFVTDSGNSNEKVLGWITDNAILEAERV